MVTLLALGAACLGGCVERRLTIRSNPPGAFVYVDNEPIGTTPAAANPVYYGTRSIKLVKDGYETKTLLQPIPAPWYEYPVLDFFAENVVPWTIRDHRVLEYSMQPQLVVPTEQLLGRAEQLRRDNAAPAVPPNQPALGPVAPTAGGPMTTAPAPLGAPGAGLAGMSPASSGGPSPMPAAGAPAPYGAMAPSGAPVPNNGLSPATPIPPAVVPMP